MGPDATRHGTLGTRIDWGVVGLLVSLVTLGVFLGSMAAFYVQGWCLLRGLP